MTTKIIINVRHFMTVERPSLRVLGVPTEALLCLFMWNAIQLFQFYLVKNAHIKHKDNT
jgi:hypothetical protein